jgi:hypothetical protein
LNKDAQGVGCFQCFWSLLGVFGWEVFWEPLGLCKFWWDLGLGDWNLEIQTLQLSPQGLIYFHVFVGFG